jgi:UPF0716 family protein affecting phage T7 exclusion
MRRDCQRRVLGVRRGEFAAAIARMWERVWLALASVLVISPGRTATLAGLVLALSILLRQKRFRRAVVQGRGNAG